MTVLVRNPVFLRTMCTIRTWAPKPRVLRDRFSLRSMSSSASSLTTAQKEELVGRLLAIKEESGLSFDEIAERCGTTNAYMAQMFHNQAQLKEATAKRLKEVLPGLTEEDISLMSRAPWRCYDPEILQEPHVYRMNEAVMHYGRSIKSLINEKFGDGIMSAIDFYVRVDKVKGVGEEDRVVITMNGKFLPHLEQLAETDTSRGTTTDHV